MCTSIVLQGRARLFARAVLLSLGLSLLAFSPSYGRDEVPTGIPGASIATSFPSNGDPGGVRRALAARGIQYGLSYTGEVLGNVSGGLKQSAHTDGLIEATVDLDLQKLLGWHGLTMHASGLEIYGTSIALENLGSFIPVSSIEAFPATRLFELWFEQNLDDDRISIRFGQMAIDEEFFTVEGARAFMNGTWGIPSLGADNLPHGGPAYPLAAPGVRVSFSPADRLGVMAAIYNGDVANDCPLSVDPQICNPHGLDFPIGDGALIVGEVAYNYMPSDAALPGTLKLGGWFHTGDFADQRVDRAGGKQGVSGLSPFQHDGNHALYAVVEQKLWSPEANADRGVAIFARVFGSPSGRNQIDFYADAGLTFKGMLFSRATDVLGVGFAYSAISDPASDFDRDRNAAVVRSYEAMLEVSYTIDVIPGWIVRPDFQYFWNPGGNVENPARPGRAVEDAAVFGLRTSINY